MSTIIDKSQMTEEDIKLNYITPALLDKGWKNKITMETAVKLTDGLIKLYRKIPLQPLFHKKNSLILC